MSDLKLEEREKMLDFRYQISDVRFQKKDKAAEIFRGFLCVLCGRSLCSLWLRDRRQETGAKRQETGD